MTVNDVCEKLRLSMCTKGGGERPVSGGYCSDLLSDVLANAKPGDLWITIQTHVNVVAVASLIGVAGVIITGGKKPEAATVTKAEQEGVPLMVSEARSFETAGRLYELLREADEVLRG
ncbi:MAG TPA: serine kinase [Firmicutes bacterium]|nr:serine kinase [Bacillota bacterium]